MVGITRATFYRHVEKKGITMEENDEGNPVVDVSELLRIYGNKVKTDTVSEQNNAPLNTNAAKTGQGAGTEITGLKIQVEMLEASQRREREILEDQIEHLKNTLSKAQDGQNKLTMLLEHKEQDGAGDWGRSLKALEQRIANQEKTAQEKQEREEKILRQNRALKKALDAEKSKGFFQKLFG